MDIGPQVIKLIEVLDPDMLDQLCNRKYRPGIQPFGKIIAVCVKCQDLIRNIQDFILKCRKVSSPANFPLVQVEFAVCRHPMRVTALSITQINTGLTEKPE